ncbi:MAG TPA: C40 family peptidase [Acidimicrobiales bacterium]|nr:C40 family peptidase [Acidimicrobiales bacterium]
MASPLRVLAAATAVIGAAGTSMAVGAAALVVAPTATVAAGAVGVATTGGATGAGADAPSAGAAGAGGTAAADVAVAWAMARVGTPYRWGGEGPDGFDCSGLVQAAYAAAGVALPRVAQAQYEAGPQVGTGPVRPGDLVFFGSSPVGIDHVGIALGDGDMVDAPHTGAVVRVEPVWSSGFVGATRPA